MSNVLGFNYIGSHAVLNDVIYSGSTVVTPPIVTPILVPGSSRGDIAYFDTQMTNLTIGYNNYTNSAVLTGGGWNNSYPLANLKTGYLTELARTSSAAAGNTQFTIDLGTAKIVKALALINTNISAAGATYRIIGSNDAGFASLLYDSGTNSCNAYTPDLIIKTGTGTIARYWRVLIIDTANAAGFINIGRLFIGNAFSAGDNFDYGCERGFKTETAITTSTGDVDFSDERAMRRTTRLTMSWLTDTEASQVLVLQRLSNISNEVLLIENPMDTTFNQQRHYLARLSQLTAIQNPYHSANTETFDFLELVNGII